MIEEVKKQVFELLNNENSGHGVDHINRVLTLALKFAEQEKADKEIVALIALLHDADDYKLFGLKNAESLPNAKRIMRNAKVSENIKRQVIESLKTIGYRKLLQGFRPKTIEGQIVSDADMCDALGSHSILRTYAYQIKNNKPFFDRTIFPIENMTADKYKICTDSGVCHMFEKILRLKNLMMTQSGKMEAVGRHQIVVDFLRHFFDEENAYEWKEYLDNYLKNQEFK